MFEKFIKNYGFYIIVIVITSIIFYFGYFIGRYGIKSAATLEQAENYKQQQSTVETVIITETAADTESEATPALVNLGQFELTAYCPCEKCCGKSDGITATGTKATAGRTIAVDPSVIPYGKEVIIDGHTYVAEDCGGAVKGDKIDVFFTRTRKRLRSESVKSQLL